MSAAIGHERETAATRRRMLAFGRLAEQLAPESSAPDLGARVLACVRDDVEALVAYRILDDGSLILLLHEGCAAAPPAHARSAAEICGRDLVELAAPAGATQFLKLEQDRPPWIGARASGLAVVAIGERDQGDGHGLVLFVLRSADGPASLAALLDLSAGRIMEALLRDDRADGEPAARADRITQVLLIDDEELVVFHVRRILERAGFAFHAAHSAQGGFGLARSIRPDVILIDKVLPDLDGIGLLRMMRGDPSLCTVPVIMLSGQADETARVVALGEGADDFVVKPFSAKELVARIEANVRLVRLRRAAVWRQGELVRLRQSQQELRKLFETVQQVRDDERRTLAREIHDQLGQLLTAAKIDIRLLQRRLAAADRPLSAAQIGAELGSALWSVDMAIGAVQNIALLLRPPELEKGGLVAALRWLAADLQRRTGIEGVLRHDPEGYVEQPPFVAGELLRMCQEALTNVLRHAGATRVVIQVVVRHACLLIRICDDGAGIGRDRRHDPASLGLKGLRERATGIGASVHVYGRKGRGTMVAIRRKLVSM